MATVVGSGVMGERLTGGNVAVAFLAISLATGGILIVLVLSLGPVSGGHFNPVVTLAMAWADDFGWRRVAPYLGAQFLGAFTGAAAAHAMFGLAVFSASVHPRDGSAQIFSEFVATFGLLLAIWGCTRFRPSATPYAVGAYIASAYWFTAPTSFANPAVALARTASNTFVGIRRAGAPGFIAAQIVGALASTVVFRWLIANRIVVEAEQKNQLPAKSES